MSSRDAANVEPAELDGPGSAASTSASLLGRVGRWLGAHASTPLASGLSPLDVKRMHRQLRQCFESPLPDFEANTIAKTLMERYLGADVTARQVILRVMALEALKHDNTGLDLSGILDSARIRFFKRFNAIQNGLAFLVELRADMLEHKKTIDGLGGLEVDLGSLLSTWFDVGFLELSRITWDSPASLLEKLMRYEAVHEIASWTDLRNRLDSDRRCYAFFHPRLPKEPLIFVEVAFLKELAGDVNALLNEAAPLEDLTRVRWAVFYSISNTQKGLRGVSFGNFLLKRVIEALTAEIPQLNRFATLSPIPGLVSWLKSVNEGQAEGILGMRNARGLRAQAHRPMSLAGEDLLAWLSSASESSEIDEAKRDVGERLAAYYLARTSNKFKQPLDPVARFHLGNGARIERLNWRADTSAKGRAESMGMMVNYQYLIAELDENLARLNNLEPRLSRSVSRLLAK